uniref:Uncharacterized protein n=1 Tax=Oryza sativa subsp. japonica TaxID=39947 RepID=Q8H431_ORYSJ|nr:hypothetical protein [Oryza sativa Japonica Group]
MLEREPESETDADVAWRTWKRRQVGTPEMGPVRRGCAWRRRGSAHGGGEPALLRGRHGSHG